MSAVVKMGKMDDSDFVGDDDIFIGDVVLLSSQDEFLLDREFLGWHLPRKQFIRLRQWCHHVRNLIRERKAWYAENGLGYLTLPGDDLLDVRVLEGVCQPANVKLRYLGYNQLSAMTPRAFASDLAVHELGNRSYVDQARSRVINERIENVAQPKSTAYREVERSGPFGVINLDLCRSVGREAPLRSPGMLAALRTLLEVQSRASTPWLLFVTTRSNRSSFHADTLSKFVQIVVDNVQENDDFGSGIEKLGVDLSRVSSGSSGRSETSRVLGLGFGKWLLHLGLSRSPRWQAQLLDSYWYSVDGDGPDMLSLAFRFETDSSLSDKTGLTSNRDQQSYVTSEAEQAVAMLHAMGRIQDPDEIFRADTKTFNKIVRQAGDLLMDAHYDAGKYKEFVKAWADKRFDSA